MSFAVLIPCGNPYAVFPEEFRWPGPRSDPPARIPRRDCARERSWGMRSEAWIELTRRPISSLNRDLRASSEKTSFAVPDVQ